MEKTMQKTLVSITLALILALFCSSALWAGNGKGMRDGSMLEIDLDSAVTIAGTVSASGIAGAGLTIDTGAGEFVTVYGLGSQAFWNSLGVVKPQVGEEIELDAVEVTFSDTSTRLIAISLTMADGTIITLRTAEGPVWRGGRQAGGACVNGGTCVKGGTCPLGLK